MYEEAKGNLSTLPDVQLSQADLNQLEALKRHLEGELENEQFKKMLEDFIRKELNGTWENKLNEKCMELIRKQPLDKINMEDISNELMKFGKEVMPAGLEG